MFKYSTHRELKKKKKIDKYSFSAYLMIFKCLLYGIHCVIHMQACRVAHGGQSGHSSIPCRIQKCSKQQLQKLWSQAMQPRTTEARKVSPHTAQQESSTARLETPPSICETACSPDGVSAVKPIFPLKVQYVPLVFNCIWSCCWREGGRLLVFHHNTTCFKPCF